LKVVQYFLWLIHQEKPSWIDENIEGIIAIAAPTLGAPKLLKSLLTGEMKLGLDLFVSDEETIYITRACCNYSIPINQSLAHTLTCYTYSEYSLAVSHWK
jgi:hypothetical protein